MEVLIHLTLSLVPVLLGSPWLVVVVGTGLPLQGGVMSQGRTVVHVTNLDDQVITTDTLFSLFGVYGNVYRVKIFYPKKDQALIQFADGEQASLATQNLNGVNLFGRPLSCTVSRHLQVQIPHLKDDQPNENLFKEYTNSPYHRFKKPGSKNAQNIYPPSKTVHVSNIPISLTKEEVEGLFAPYGSVRTSRTIPSTNVANPTTQMSLVEMGSVDEAVTALIALHNSEVDSSQGSRHLHVTFARQATL